ncbi:hypothetical protein BD779DRAFT_1465317 [Infundibulicybe gibba]|nr:hypothetical protein BD779DRAFT_1465317 [Infundibulicybe gibba]
MHHQYQPTNLPSGIPFRKDRVRLILLSKRKEGITNEEFSEYWANSHARLFSSVPIVRQNLLKYEQAHTSEQTIPLINSIGFSTAKWDGIAVFEATSYDKILAIFDSEEYKNIVIPDELKFADRDANLMLPLDLLEVINHN